MAYDEQLADRIRDTVEGEPGITEKRMFGGLAFLLHGNLAVAASGQGGLMLRCDAAESAALVQQPGVARVEMRGQEMQGWVRVEPGAVVADEALRHWVGVGLGCARSLPPRSS